MKYLVLFSVICLATCIRQLSTNFRIGFGSFVDKRVGPFVELDPAIQQNPCPNDPRICEPTYSYRHVISLTDDADEFNVMCVYT